MTTIVHLVVDDKFIDAAIREFEAVAPGRHEYLIVEGRPPWRFVRSAQVAGVDAARFAQRVAAGDVAAVVLHGLPATHYRLLAQVPPGPAVVWLGWGYDYYGLIADAFPDGLLQPATAEIVDRLQPRLALPHAGTMAASRLSIARPYPKPTARERAALARVDIFSPVLDVEYALLRRCQPTLRAQYRPWNYLTLEDDLELDAPPAAQPGPNLLVGNSATPTNNHVEAFDLIRRRVDLDGRRVVVPLSYGDAAYAREVVRIGREMFGRAFEPLTAYLPRDEYLTLLDSCGLVVMNHRRQQALGNVVIGGLRGARLFLDPANPMTRWLHRQGVAVDDIGTVDSAPLAAAVRDRNRAAIAAFTCRAHRRGLTRRLVDELLGESGAAALAA